MRNSASDKKVYRLVITALMMAIILVATMLFKIPIPLTQGYVHLGDGMIFLALYVVGKRNGAIAAGAGSCLGDILGGFAAWAPWTFIIKLLMAFGAGIFIERIEKSDKQGIAAAVPECIGMILGGAIMCAGYYVAEGIMYGNWVASALGVPWNIGQFAIGIVVAMLVSRALGKTPAKKYLVSGN